MSITKNVFRLNDVYDLVNSGEWIQYDNSSDSGQLWAWGENTAGKLGDGTVITRSSPVQIPGVQWTLFSVADPLGGFVGLSAALKSDGTLWSWGRNLEGRLGQNNTIDRSSPVQIPGTQWNSLSTRFSHTLATKLDNTLWAWGCNSYGFIGDNTTINRSSPVQVPGTLWNDVSGGNTLTLARKA